MNFYSDDIINNIIDNEELETIADKIDRFYKLIENRLLRYSYRAISTLYTERLLKFKNNKIAFYCMDTEFSIDNCPSCLIYHKYANRPNHEINYYILMMCTKPKFKNLGYASRLLNGFIDRVKEETIKRENDCVKIIVSSLDTAVTFYQSYGFRQTEETILEHPRLLRFEKYEENKEYYILELVIKTPFVNNDPIHLTIL